MKIKLIIGMVTMFLFSMVNAPNNANNNFATSE